MVMRMTRRAALGGIVLAVAGCGAPVQGPGDAPANSFSTSTSGDAQIAALQAAILSLGDDVSPDEAARVARIAVQDPLVWAQEWGAVDRPLIHNIQVNTGAKPRGLCKDWADDLEARLRREGLHSLELHRAIANSTNIRIEHSTVIVTRRGAPMDSGIVLDPWRRGQGRLYYVKETEDPKYHWIARAEVFAMKRARAARRGRD
jgi:hypothetical protein